VDQSSQNFFVERRKERCIALGFQILNIPLSFGDICAQSGKVSEIGPKTLNYKNNGFSCFFLQFVAAPCTSRVNCDEMARDRPRQFANRNCYRLLRIS